MFHKARIKLTVWYLAIIMTISILFSLIIYSGIDREFGRFERFERNRTEQEQRVFLPSSPPQPFQPFNSAMVAEARDRLAFTLILINLGILGLSGFAGYFLAGRTLRPIKEMVDDQNRFITDSSHELRTPLTSLRSEIEVGLRNKKMGLSDARHILESNLEDVISLQTLSDSLLELSQNGHLVNKKYMEEVSLSNITKNAVRKVENLAKTKQIKIESRIGNVKVYAVADRLTEVFVVLLDNAIKYSKKKGSITISSKIVNNAVRISVTDHGIGIEEDDLSRVFDRFFRANKSRSKNDASGYGLGLSIAKKIVDFHNGYILVKSIPGKETTFSVFLPI